MSAQARASSPQITFTGGRSQRSPVRRREGSSLGEDGHAEGSLFIPKFVSKAAEVGVGFKFAIFGGLHGDEEAGVLAAFDLVRWAATSPIELSDFELHIYPVCNPTGHESKSRHNWSGLDLNREFWVGSPSPEVSYLEAELRREHFDGIIQLHSDDTSDGCYGFVSGSLLSEHLICPALAAADELLPRNGSPVIDGFLASSDVIKEGYQGILCGPPEQRPRPVEIVFETPALAPLSHQVNATTTAVKTILAEYRRLQAYAADL